MAQGNLRHQSNQINQINQINPAKTPPHLQ
jgi:hypothetical protein